MIWGCCVLLSLSIVREARAQTKALPNQESLPSWVNETGSRVEPESRRIFTANSFGAVGDGVRKSTKPIQEAIDACAKAGGGIVTLKPGRYVTGALFLKTNVHLRLDREVVLLGSQDDADYPSIPTRVAGIEMNWPAALINVNDQQNVKIDGNGTIDGRGEKWWNRYRDLRGDYDPKGLRWAADYDAQRVRLMVIWKSQDVTVQGLNLQRSGFWTVHVVYSEHVTVDGVKITMNGGPSTDGVDIDSSRYVRVENCDIDTEDDDICLKAGRDTDGMRVNRPTEYIYIRNNIARHGNSIISFGSETSGGIRNVVAEHNRGISNFDGIRFKSARTRGGFVEDVLIRDLTMDQLNIAFVFDLNWHPDYSYASIPKGVTDIPASWAVLAAPVTPPERGFCEIRNITIQDVTITRARRIFSAKGLLEKPLTNVTLVNISAQGGMAGRITYARNWTIRNLRIKTFPGDDVVISDSENVPAVVVGDH